MRHIKRIVLFLPVFVMMTIAAIQAYLVITTDLSPWRAGGFGMFSSIDNVSTRYVRAVAIIDGDLKPFDLSTFKKDTLRLRVLPSKKAFTVFLNLLSCSSLALSTGASEVMLSLWTAKFDATTSMMTPVLKWQAKENVCDS